MKNIYSLSFLLLLTLNCALAQINIDTISVDSVAMDTIWTKTTNFGLNFNQASFSENWNGGGINSLAFSSLFNYQANYKREPWSWDNTIDLLYGIINNQGNGFRKSQDRIFLDSKIGYDISEEWNGYGSLNFLTQFAPGYRYVDLPSGDEDALRVSDFLAPAFFTMSLGFEYAPSKNFSLRLSPFSPRITIVNDTTLYRNFETVNGKSYGVDSRAGETVRTEWLAFQLLAKWNKDITENINLQARYLSFVNYENLSFEQTDHRLDLTLAAKLTRYINVNFSAIAIYDFDQIDEIQFSQLLGVGILINRENAVVE